MNNRAQVNEMIGPVKKRASGGIIYLEESYER